MLCRWLQATDANIATTQIRNLSIPALASTTRLDRFVSNARYIPFSKITRRPQRRRDQFFKCARSHPVVPMVGLGGLEPPTSPLSGVRSNHLSYRPEFFGLIGKAWWSQSGSNRRPPACKAGALPAELWPHRGRSRGLPPKRLAGNYWMQVTCADAWTGKCRPVSKGGDPAAPSDTATLLRLHPSHESHRGNRPLEG